ncbi:MAG: hypothetical protein KME29_15800 [Calothrix sp. FI2-JRJ7]|jgi:hypothetical protein|nr:hypothetical protein [Calothrix sp. FI2-JRJ7]
MKEYLDNLYLEYLKLEEKAWREVDRQCFCICPGSQPKCITCPSSILMRKKIRSMISEEYFPPTYINIEDDEYYELLKEFCTNKSVVAIKDVDNYLKDRFAAEGYCQLNKSKVQDALKHLGYKRKNIKFYLDEVRYCPIVYYLDEESLNKYRKEKREAFNQQYDYDEAKFQRSFKAVEEYCKDKRCFFAEDIYRQLVYLDKSKKAYKNHVGIALEQLGYQKRLIDKIRHKRIARVTYYLSEEDLDNFVDRL